MKLLFAIGLIISCLCFPVNAYAIGNTPNTIFTQPTFEASFMEPSNHFLQVANRRGSHRVGGTNRHGKGSHYNGGHKA